MGGANEGAGTAGHGGRAQRNFRLTSVQVAEFRRARPAAVFLIGSINDVFMRRDGQAEAAWHRPVRLSITQSWEDHITRQVDRESPLWSSGVIWRVWCEDEVRARRLIEIAQQQGFASRWRPLRMSWMDAGDAFDADMAELEMHHLAREAGMRAWDDASLAHWLMVRAAARAGA